MAEQPASTKAILDVAARDRARARRNTGIVAATAAAVVAVVVIGATVAVVTILNRFDTSEELAQTQACRARLEALYDDQQSQFLDAADTRNAPARATTRENMRRVVVARLHVHPGRRCPEVELEAVPPPAT